MHRNIGLKSFWLATICLGLSLYWLLSFFFLLWSLIPPGFIYILLGIAILSFFTGIVGFKEITNWRKAIRSWFTVLLSFGLSLILGIVFAITLLFPEVRELISTTYSPDHHYEVNFYLTDGGATTSFGIIGEMNGPLWFKKKIYNDYMIDHATVQWKNNYTLSINGHVLDLKKGQTYDFTTDLN